MKKALIITLVVALQGALVCVGSLWARQDLAEQAFQKERKARLDWNRDRAVNRQIDYPGFLVAGQEAYRHRRDRRIGVQKFLEMARDEDTIILDTRSKAKFDDIHIAGATHLNFSDFTEEALAKVIPSKDTRVLIYCNNNFDVETVPEESVENRGFGAKMDPMALNIPTYINLYGYGYRNIYELAPVVNPRDTHLTLVSSEQESGKRMVRAVAATESEERR